MSKDDPFDPSPEAIQISEENYVKSTQQAADVKKELVRLDGLALTEDGKVTQTKFFNFLKISAEDYSDLAFTQEEAEVISQHLRFMRTGLNAVVPIYCGGEDKCPFKRSCPFLRIKKAPIGRICPIEDSLIKVWTEDYVREFNVDPGNLSDLSLVSELAELDIYERRATFMLTEEGDSQLLLQDQPVGIDGEGNAVYQTQIHQAWEIKERIKNRRLKVLEALVGTRKEQYKRDAALKQKSTGDPASEMARYRQTLEEMRKKHQEEEA